MRFLGRIPGPLSAGIILSTLGAILLFGLPGCGASDNSDQNKPKVSSNQSPDTVLRLALSESYWCTEAGGLQVVRFFSDHSIESFWVQSASSKISLNGLSWGQDASGVRLQQGGSVYRDAIVTTPDGQHLNFSYAGGAGGRVDVPFSACTTPQLQQAGF